MVFFWAVGVGIVSRLTANTHPEIASPLLAVEFRLVGEIPTFGLPTIRELASLITTSAFMRIYPDCSSAIRLDEPFELLAPLISQVVITTVTSGAVVQSQSVC